MVSINTVYDPEVLYLVQGNHYSVIFIMVSIISVYDQEVLVIVQGNHYSVIL